MPKWQKARLSMESDVTPGMEMWVRVGPPRDEGPSVYRSLLTGEIKVRPHGTRWFDTHFLDDEGDVVVLDDDMGALELLPEFAEEVATVRLTDAVREHEARKVE